MTYTMKKFILFVLIILTLTGCKHASKHSIGNPYEVLVVCDDQTWEAPAGRALLYALDTDIPGLPQSERSFRISRVTKSHFRGSTKAFRNIIFVDINGDRYTKNSFKFTRDVFAKPQVYMGIQSPSMEEFEKFVNENSQVIVDFLTRVEIERQIGVLEGKYNEKAFKKIKEMFGCELKIPAYLNGYMAGENFLWLSDFNDPKAEIQSFMIYSYPYTSVDNFSREHYIHMRDSVMKRNIRAKRMDQYIKTVDWSVDITEGSYRDRYLQVVRGLWEMENDIMGGPFVSHSAVDEINNRVIVVEAFLYAPNRKKGSMMRKLEASLFTLKLPADKFIEESNRLEEFSIEEKK